jgi:hypothetical protein
VRRDADGRIKRDPLAKRAFMEAHPCPAPVTAEWVRRRNEIMDRLDQAAIEACLEDCRTPEEREAVLACLRERARKKT